MARAGRRVARSDAFEIGYGMSFPTFDACGDATIGQAFRRAILEHFAQCPFSADARAKFEAWRVEELEEMASTLFEIRAAGLNPIGPHELYDWSTTPPRQIMSCAAYRQTQSYLEQRARIERYAMGAISAAEALRMDCPSGPASL